MKDDVIANFLYFIVVSENVNFTEIAREDSVPSCSGKFCVNTVLRCSVCQND